MHSIIDRLDKQPLNRAKKSFDGKRHSYIMTLKSKPIKSNQLNRSPSFWA